MEGGKNVDKGNGIMLLGNERTKQGGTRKGLVTKKGNLYPKSSWEDLSQKGKRREG